MKEPTRARYPDESGHVERDGVRVYWERYGEGSPTLLLMPPWSIVHSRCWKAQIPYFARHFRVVTFDPRGNGRSDRPRGAGAYSWREFTADSLAVLDATGTEQAVLVGGSRGANWELGLAAQHPERVLGAVFAAISLPLSPWPPWEDSARFLEETSPFRRVLLTLSSAARCTPLLARSHAMRLFSRRVRFFEGAKKFNLGYWREDFQGFLEWFFGTIEAVEPHSTRLLESLVEYGLETDPEILAATYRAEVLSRQEIEEMSAAVRCPVLVIHGSEDITCPIEWGEELARLTRTELVRVEGADHLFWGRRPVVFNLAVRKFVESLGQAPSRGSVAAGARS